MEFGRVDSLDGIDLSLPDDDPGNAAVFAAAAASGKPAGRVYVGLPIWNDSMLAKRLLPRGTKPPRRLAEYAKILNSAELNASGYGLKASNAAAWAAATGEGFRFCPKVPRTISHARSLDGTGAAFDGFVADAGAFGNRLGPAFLQFGESFGPSRLPELERFLRAQAGKLHLAVELRHPAWFQGRPREALFGLLRELRVCAVITDVPGRRDLLHQRLTAPWAFIRFSGHDLGPQDLSRLDPWVETAKRWLDGGLAALFFFPHHEPKHFSADWAARFIASLNVLRPTGLAVPGVLPPSDEVA